jgi:cell division protein FtsA
MDEKARFAVGIDLGTSNVRAVMGRVNSDGTVHIVGYGQAPSEGLRRGSVKELNSPVKAIDMCLRQVEELSGIEVHEASVSINGVSVGGTKIDGMIAVGVADHEINEDDIVRIADTAIAGKVPANRETLALVPYEYILDGQGGIREPLGMHGARLELRANVVSALAPDCENMRKVCESAQLEPHGPFEPAVVAAARAVTNSAQRENGVGVVDMGGATTSLAIFDEGELQFVGVIPIGSNDITKDLATVLATIPDVAEEIKIRFVSATKENNDRDIVVKRGRELVVV